RRRTASTRRRSSRLGGLGAVAQAPHHLLLHHEVEEIEGVGTDRATRRSHEEPRAILGLGAEEESPGAACAPARGQARPLGRGDEDHRVWRVDERDHLPTPLPPPLRISQPHRVTGLAVLPARVDRVRIVHARRHEVLEHRVAVEAGAVLSDLHEPRPHPRDRRVDGDGPPQGTFASTWPATGSWRLLPKLRGADAMGSRILVVYQTSEGQTAKIAERIAATLREGGNDVDVRDVEHAPAPDSYDGVV